MFRVEVVPHKKLSELALTNICNVKSAFGNYGTESQIQWIRENIDKEDLHFIVSKDERIVAYANIINTTLEIDAKNISVLGVGNVCVSHKSMGLGRYLMNQINLYIKNQDMIGFLLCKENLVSFYVKCGWFEKEVENVSSYSLLFNFDSYNSRLKYSGRKF